MSNKECCQRYYRKNRRKVIAANEVYRKAHLEINRVASLKWRSENPELRMWSATRSRAKAKGIEFSISVDDINIPEHCPILGVKLVAGKGRGSGRAENSPSIDRVDNSKGYVPGNVAVISGRANKIKNSGTADEHRKIAKWIDYFTGKAMTL